MKLSIVVICLNEQQHLPRCLRAINELDHAGLEVEVIVADGGSTDRTRQVARQLGARVVDSPRGIPRQRNEGGRAATGELLAYVDADIELQGEWFATVARRFAQRRDLILGCPPRLPEDASWIARAYALHWGAGPDDTAPMEESADERLLSTASLVMGRDLFDRLGGFSEELGVDEDTFLILAAKEQGVPLVCDPELRYIHHGEPRTLGEFFRRVAWGSNFEQWFRAIRRGDLNQAWRPQYLYGAAVGGSLVALGASLALPVGGWQVGVPLSLCALSAVTVLPAAQTARRHRAYDKIGDLCLMYGTYGLATACAMFGMARDKARRWR